MQPKVLKYILDIESCIEEIDQLLVRYDYNYLKFEKDFLAIRSLERLLEIIGEATKNLLEVDVNIKITNSQRIISLRNRLAHAYDNIQSDILWSIAIKDIPKLKEEILNISNS